MNYFIIIVIFVTLVLLFIFKDYLKILKYTSIATVLSGILTFIIAFLIKMIITKNLSFIRISDVINIIVSRFVLNGIRLLILGLIESTIYFIINYGVKNKKEMIKQK